MAKIKDVIYGMAIQKCENGLNSDADDKSSKAFAGKKNQTEHCEIMGIVQISRSRRADLPYPLMDRSGSSQTN
jgi:hypothetical protein